MLGQRLRIQPYRTAPSWNVRLICQASGSLASFRSSRRVRIFRDPPLVTRIIQAALLAAILWVIEVYTSNV
jgi:hypothetical protein